MPKRNGYLMDTSGYRPFLPDSVCEEILWKARKGIIFLRNAGNRSPIPVLKIAWLYGRPHLNGDSVRASEKNFYSC